MRTTAILIVAALPLVSIGAGQNASQQNYSAEIALRGVEYDPASGLVTLRWQSQAGKPYAIEETSNPELGWRQSVSEISGLSGETTLTVLPQAHAHGAKTMLFRIRELSETEAQAKERGDSEIDGELAGHDDLSKAAHGLDRAGADATPVTAGGNPEPDLPWNLFL